MKYPFEQKTVDDAPSDEEALRLTLAFYCIMEPEKQAIVLALAERYAERSRLAVEQQPVVEEVTRHDQ